VALVALGLLIARLFRAAMITFASGWLCGATSQNTRFPD
jgi:hypothetical protein